MDKKSSRRITRRSFVQSSLAGAGVTAAWPWSSPTRGQQSSRPQPLDAAIIGAGGIGCFHAASHFHPYFHIGAVCDVDRTRAESFNQQFCHGQAKQESDYRELLQRDFDVVFICTPDHWHAKIAIEALHSGKDVYCEKPLTLTIDEGRLIEEALSQTDRILQVGTQQRSDPNFQTAVALARSGRLGPVKRITAAIGGGSAGGPFATELAPEYLDWDRWLGQAPLTDYIPQRCHGNFRWWYEYSGGKMTDWGAHHVDIAYWALPEVTEGTIKINPVEYQHPVTLIDGFPTATDQYNTATSFRVECEFPGGAQLVIRDNAEDLGFENGLLFECEEGRYFVNRGKLTGKPIEQLADDPLPEELLASLRKQAEPISHMANFQHCCFERKEPISDVSSHMEALSVCHLANIAMRLGRPLEWDPQTRQIIGDEEASKWLARPQREGFEIG